VKPTSLRMNKQYIIYYQTWTWVFSTGLIPFASLLYLNIRILISLRNLRSRLNIRYQDSQACNPVKVKLREMRANQQSRDFNLAVVLITSVVMFLFCHAPRLITSVYEAANIHSILHCREKGRDKTPLWFMYVTATVQFLMVANASFNLPIYFFAGKSFRENSLDLLKKIIPGFILRFASAGNRGWRCFNCGAVNLSNGAELADGRVQRRNSGISGNRLGEELITSNQTTPKKGVADMELESHSEV